MIGEKKKVKLFNGRYKLVTLVTLDAHGVMSRKQPLAGYRAPLPDLGASSGLQTKISIRRRPNYYNNPFPPRPFINH